MSKQTIVFNADPALDSNKQAVEDRRRSWAQFYAAPYVVHIGGETYIEERCPDDCPNRGTVNWRYCAHPIPTRRESTGPDTSGHAVGVCWGCTTEAPAPEGWSVLERLAVEARAADAPPLRLPPMARRGGEGGVDKGDRARIRRTRAAERLMDR